MTGEADFWSRRRAGVAAETQAEDAARDHAELAQAHAALEEKTDDEILAELDLREPETLGLGDDFSAFMSKAVPDRIRRRALRVLWRSNPVLANVDAMVDYGEDFTDKANVVENLQTAYQVGKGMLRHVEEMARQAEAAASAAVDEDDPEMPEIEAEEVLAEAPDAATPPHETFVAYEEEEGADYAPPTPRRMKFRTGEAA